MHRTSAFRAGRNTRTAVVNTTVAAKDGVVAACGVVSSFFAGLCKAAEHDASSLDDAVSQAAHEAAFAAAAAERQEQRSQLLAQARSINEQIRALSSAK